MLSNETNVRGISNVIKAEQFPLQTEIVLQQVLGNNVDQSIPIQVRPEQGYSNQQYVYSQYQPKQAGPQQQVVYMNNQAPQVVVIYATPMLTLEYQFINQYRWFNGCGCLQSIYMIFTLYLRSIAAFYLDQVPHVDQDSILVAKITGALYILQQKQKNKFYFILFQQKCLLVWMSADWIDGYWKIQDRVYEIKLNWFIFCSFT